MDKSVSFLLPFISSLVFFVVFKDLLLSLIIFIWLLIVVMKLSNKILLVIGIIFLLYYVLFGSINIVYAVLMIFSGLITGIISPQKASDAKTKKRINITPNLKIYLLAIIFFIVLFISYKMYQGRPIKIDKDQKPIPNIIELK